jgi:2-haloacid dehalogenase
MVMWCESGRINAAVSRRMVMWCESGPSNAAVGHRGLPRAGLNRRVKEKTRSGMPPGMPVDGVLLDLLMAVMNSLEVWSAAAGDPPRGLEWRDAVTARMIAAGSYRPYDQLVHEAAAEIGLPPNAASELFDRWTEMEPWPDATELAAVTAPYAFVTNCSTTLARMAADRAGLRPRFTLSAEEAGWYKPHAEIYRAACQRLGSAPERTMFVAGAPYDAEGARAAGLQAWLVRRRTDQPVPDAAIRVASSLGEALATLDRRWLNGPR